MAAQNDELRAHLRNKENLRFLINERSIKISQEAEELKVSKEKLDEHIRRLQGTIEELERKGRAVLSWDIVRILMGHWWDTDGIDRTLGIYMGHS